MKIQNASDVPPIFFDTDAAKGVAGRVLIGKNDGADNFCMRMFELAPGGHSPRHSHEWEHEIFIYKGKGAVLNNGEWVSVEPGCSIFIPGNEEHQMKNMGDDPFVFICLIPSGVPEM